MLLLQVYACLEWRHAFNFDGVLFGIISLDLFCDNRDHICGNSCHEWNEVEIEDEG